MNYGYIVGQELASLTYFENRLLIAYNPNERRDLETVIQNIKRTLRVYAERKTPSEAVGS